MITIKQGESKRIFFALKQDGRTLTPELCQDLMICVGCEYSKTYLSGGVKFDSATKRWYIFPTSQETSAMSAGIKEVCSHTKYYDGTLIITELDKMQIKRSCCGGTL